MEAAAQSDRNATFRFIGLALSFFLVLSSAGLPVAAASKGTWTLRDGSAEIISYPIGVVNLLSLGPSSFKGHPGHIVQTPFYPEVPAGFLGGNSPRSQISPSLKVVKSSDGLHFIDSPCGCLPPDGAVAAGPLYYIEMVNTEYRVTDKSTLATITQNDLNSLFMTPYSIADARVIFDSASQRFFSVVTTFGCGGTCPLLVGVSMNSDPLSWSIFPVSPCTKCSGAVYGDYPYLGVTSDKLTISVNAFSNSTPVGANVVVINKADLVGGVLKAHEILLGKYPKFWSAAPVQSTSSVSDQFLVSEANPSGPTSVLRLFKIQGVPGVSVVSVSHLNLALPHSINSPPSADQPGALLSVATNDQKILSAQFFRGNIWLSFNDGCIPSGDSKVEPCAGIVEVANATKASPVVAQDFDVSQSGAGFYYPSVAITPRGIVIVTEYSSAVSFISVYATGRGNADPANTWRSPVLIAAGNGVDSYTFRWGDFNGIALDPSNTKAVWVEGEYVPANAGSDIWATYVAQVTL